MFSGSADVIILRLGATGAAISASINYDIIAREHRAWSRTMFQRITAIVIWGYKMKNVSIWFSMKRYCAILCVSGARYSNRCSLSSNYMKGIKVWTMNDTLLAINRVPVRLWFIKHLKMNDVDSAFSSVGRPDVLTPKVHVFTSEYKYKRR